MDGLLHDPRVAAAAQIAGFPALLGALFIGITLVAWPLGHETVAIISLIAGSVLVVFAAMWFGVALVRAMLSLAGPSSRLVRLLRNVGRVRVMLKPIAGVDQAQSGAGPGALLKLSTERDELKKALVSSQRLNETQQAQISARDGQIANLEPVATWAKALIDRERSAPAARLIRVHCFLNRERYLSAAEAEPYFDIDVSVDYVGALRLVVETVQMGNLSWNDRAFAIAPKVTQSQLQELPFEDEGPTICNLRIRQHVSKDKAAELKSELEANGGLRLITGGLRISATLKDYAGDSVKVLESALGDWIEIKPRQ